MESHLDRLEKGQIFAIEKMPDGRFEIREQCDYYFGKIFTAEQLRELAAEIIKISRT